MEKNFENSQVHAIQDVCSAMNELGQVVKKKVVKYYCHEISEEEIKDFYKVCLQIQSILNILRIQSNSFDFICQNIEKFSQNYTIYEASKFFEEDILDLLDRSIEDIQKSIYYPTKRRSVKIKYVDFYGEFVPEEHWTYKLLSEKYDIVFSDMPDYLFFSCFGNQYLNFDCIRIFISNEAVYPNLNLYDYAVTYSDFKITDRLLPNRDAFEDLKYRNLAESLEEAEEILANKKEFCSFVYSNENGDPLRKELFEAVNKYKKVLSGGNYLNNIGYKVSDLESFQKQFKFFLACENSWYKGYTTEKIINAFNGRSIPVYWGNPDISDVINPKAIINCHDYPDLKSVVEEIKRLDNDDEAYKQKLMEPILNDENMVEEYLEERKRFIYNIIDQPYTKAFRRNRGLRGQWYNDWFCYLLGYENEWFTPEKGYFVKHEIESVENGPLVSILIPVYNRKEIVKQTIDSALRQNYQNIEIIVVDNCSTDGTYEVLQKYYKDSPKIKIFCNDTNIGPVNNWIACLEKAEGKYVKILWSDDLMNTRFIGCCVNIMENDTSIGMVYSKCFVFQGDNPNVGRPLYQRASGTGKYEKGIFYKEMFQDEAELPVSPGCAMMRKEDITILKDIPNELGINCNSNGAGIDLLILLQALEKHENFYYIDDIMNFFRWHNDSITATNNLIREYNLAKFFFCKEFSGASPYLQNMKMRILRDEGITDAVFGVEILRGYGM